MVGAQDGEGRRLKNLEFKVKRGARGPLLKPKVGTRRGKLRSNKRKDDDIFPSICT
jgi:hypothetical protein